MADRGMPAVRSRLGDGRGRTDLRGRGRGDTRGRGRAETASRGRGPGQRNGATVMMPAQLQARRGVTTNDGDEDGWTRVVEEMPAGFVPRGGARAAPSTVEERVEDPYDPAEPNDYMEIQRERELRKAQDRRERQRQLYLEGIEREQQRLAEERREQARRELAGEAPVPSGRGRGVSNLPAWVKARADPAKSPPKLTPMPAPEPAPASQPNTTRPTRVLVLSNIVASGDDNTDIVRAECEKHGPVEDFFALAPADTSQNEAVCFYVKFQSKSDASKAFVKFKGRFLDGRKISCEFFDEEEFLRKKRVPPDLQ